ncbi:sn-glycerol-3-phosphate ABC transporter ATP-binding protein UgpC [Bradyrhizobium sp. BR13661]|jgi:multiple sugar transport system ATP-binding protein|uniref:ABC transporter ATP-binding protein n=1 Tax=Bradyrhizobium sp. BR13661 TaxID=2940622 RepID=UPI002476B239|nr:sn-glycerol-3-phosphate ABC transporter ATP-binding protein UgpC [Bradyrhizobium sp. BR13661]MDH6262374.1 multiple sugar transport system ATP-binding protein [Bradyrhizobium sp. BR13661]
MQKSDVDIRDLQIGFGGLKVLENLNLHVGESEFLVLLGPSGCGKSTLLNAIAGLIEAKGGEIHIGGRDVTWAEPKDRGIAMVFQSYALYPRMSVRRNMSFGLTVAGTPRDEIERRVGEAAQMLRLTNLLDRRPGELSGGQRQRVAIGRALVRHAGVYLFDEPLSNLDAQLRAELRVEIKRLHARLGATMIYVTHDQIEALTLADRIAVMQGGVIQQLDTPKKIYREPVNRFVASFVGSPAMNFIPGRLARGSEVAFIAGANRLSLSGYAFRGQPTEAPAVLGIRPEHVELTESSDPSAASARIEMIEPMGADTLIWCRLADGTAFSLRHDADAQVRVGDTLSVRFLADALSLFDETSGQRL